MSRKYLGGVINSTTGHIISQIIFSKNELLNTTNIVDMFCPLM